MNATANRGADMKVEDLVRYVATEPYKATQKRDGMIGIVSAISPSGRTVTVLFEDDTTVHCSVNHLVRA